MNLEKKRLLKKLAKTYCRIGSSKVSGVGVIAIRNIPKDTNIFYGVPQDHWLNFTWKEMSGLDKGILAAVDDFFVTNKKGIIEIPFCGLNGINVSFFLNHSAKPNVKTIDGGENFVTKRKIKKGEELTLDYFTVKWEDKEEGKKILQKYNKKN